MKKEHQEPFDYELAKQKVKEQFRSGKSLFGKGGAFAPLLQEMLNSILEGEIESHLDDEERENGNRKNGKSKKLLRTSSGTIELTTPRDRAGPTSLSITRRHPINTRLCGCIKL
jgi:transposase-like protein